MTTTPTKPTTLGDRIRTARLSANLTQAQAAERSGMGQANWAAYENGRVASPTVDMLKRLAAAVGADPRDLI